jgi:S1-C subfamily serine protease
MQDNGSGDSEERPREQQETSESSVAVADSDAGGGPAEPADGTSQAPPASPKAGQSKTVRLVACVAAGALAIGVGFAITRVLQSSAPVAISSAIPSPLPGNDAFVEDDDGTGQDGQTNILQSTAPGLVHIISGGDAVGIGMVLTPSGKVLTTYLPASGAGNLEAKYVVSGVTFKAKVIGAANGLALLQLEGGNGRAFSTLQVGNSATLVDSAYNAKQLSFHVPGEVDDTAVGTSGTRDALTIDVGNLAALNATASVNGSNQTGLMQSALQAPATTEIGGPLVDLNGRVIGITVAGSGSGLHISGYAIPINQALVIAKQIDAKARPTA